MTMPLLTDAHRELRRLVGIWRGEERLFPSPWAPNGATAMGVVRNVVALDGFAVVQDYEQVRDGKVTFRGHGVFRWDPESGDYVLHWFDSSAQAPSEFRGPLLDGVLTLGTGQPHGQTRAIFDLRTEHRYHYLMQVSSDGREWHPFVEGNYTREG